MSESTFAQRYAATDSSTAGAFAFDTISAKDYAVSKIAFGAIGSVTYVDASNPLPVTLASVPTHAVTQSGTWTVQPGNTANTTAWLVTGTGGTFPATQSGTWNITNVSGTISLPTGAATAAKQPALGTAGTASADVITVQGIASMTALKVDGSAVTQPISDASGSLTVDAPVGTPVFVRLSDGSAAITTLAVSLASVPSHAVTNAGTFAVQAACTNAGTFVIQENGAALTALQLIDNIVLAEDAAHVSGDPGVQMLAVQKTADGALAGTTGDYAPLQVDDNGYLKVNIKAGAGSGGTASTDDGAFTAASGSGTPMMGFVTADSVDSGDVGVVGMLANRQLKVTLYDSGGSELAVGGGTQYTEDAAAAANPIGNALIAVRDDARGGSLTTTDGDNIALRGTNSGELYVKHVDSLTVGTHAVTQSGTWNVGTVTTVTTVTAVTAITNALPAGTNAIGKLAANSGVDIGDVDVTSVPADPFGANADAASATGSISAKLRFIAGTGIPITGTVTVGSHAVTNAGTFAVQATCTNAGTFAVQAACAGDVANDGVDSGNPTKVGGRATTAQSGLTLVADADRVNAMFGVDGAQIVRPNTNLESIVTGNASNTDGTSTQCIAAGAAGVKHYLTSIVLTNTHATTFTYVEIKDGTTVVMTIPVPPSGGAIVNLPVPIPGTVATAWNFDPGAAVTTIYCSMVGFKSKI